MAYGEALPTDSASKKFLGVLADNTGNNAFTAIAGTNLRAQNGENIADLVADVTTTSGAGATIGAANDAKVDTDAVGTLSSKLRGLVSRIVEIKAMIPATLGQKAKAASLAVTLASDEDLIALLPAALGQTTKAASLAVTLASDEDLLATAGATGDAKVDTDAVGSLSAKLRGLVSRIVEIKAMIPASLGQKTKAGSLAVTLASDEDVVSVDDAAGSLTIDSPQLPASLGQKIMAESLAVTMASNQSAVAIKPNYEYGVIYEANKSGGYTEDWLAVRNANDVQATDVLSAGTPLVISPYFNGADAAFDASVFWVKIPILNSGYKNFAVHIKNALDQNLAIIAYGVSSNVPYGVTPSYPVMSNVDCFTVWSGTVNAAASADFGNGGATQTVVCDWPVGWLVLKVTPAGDPTSGNWALSVRRSA